MTRLKSWDLTTFNGTHYDLRSLEDLYEECIDVLRAENYVQVSPNVDKFGFTTVQRVVLYARDRRSKSDPPDVRLHFMDQVWSRDEYYRLQRAEDIYTSTVEAMAHGFAPDRVAVYQLLEQMFLDDPNWQRDNEGYERDNWMFGPGDKVQDLIDTFMSGGGIKLLKKPSMVASTSRWYDKRQRLAYDLASMSQKTSSSLRSLNRAAKMLPAQLTKLRKFNEQTEMYKLAKVDAFDDEQWRSSTREHLLRLLTFYPEPLSSDKE